MLSFSSSCLRVEGQLSTACSIPVRADSSCCVTSSPFLSCRQIELLGRWEPLLAALLCGQTSSMSHCARDDVTLPPQGGRHHLPDALAPFVQHKLSVILCWSMCGPWRKWGEGTASWQGCKVLQTRAVPERQWCYGCASQHWSTHPTPVTPIACKSTSAIHSHAFRLCLCMGSGWKAKGREHSDLCKKFCHHFLPNPKKRVFIQCTYVQ